MNVEKFRYRQAILKKSLWRRLKERCKPAPIIDSPQSILIAATSLLGDFIMLAPLVIAMRQRFPTARIGLLIPPGWQDFASHVIGVDEVIEAKHNHYGWFKTFYAEQQGRWDWGVVTFLYSIMPLLYASGVKNILSFPDLRGRDYQIHQKIPLPAPAAHMSRMLLRIIGDEEGCYPAPHFHPFVGELPLGLEPKAYAIIHPGASRITRFWPAERYIAVAQLLLAKGYRIVLTGGKSEIALSSPIARALPSEQVCNLAGKTDLMGLSRVVQSAAVVIGPDTSIMHLARALDVPSVTIMGPTQNEVYGVDQHFHNTQHARTLYVGNLACRNDNTVFGRTLTGMGNCYRDQCIFADTPCLTGIDIAAVKRALEEIQIL